MALLIATQLMRKMGRCRPERYTRGTVNGVRVPGIPIHGPAVPEVQSIEVGINRVLGAHRKRPP